MKTEDIAKLCHELNRIYCVSIGDNFQPYWEDAPEWQRFSAVNGVTEHLAKLATGHDPDASWSHRLWLKEKEADGWKYGAVKDPAKKEHPCMVPFDELPAEQRLKDYLFAGVVRACHVAGA